MQNQDSNTLRKESTSEISKKTTGRRKDQLQTIVEWEVSSGDCRHLVEGYEEENRTVIFAGGRMKDDLALMN